MNRKLYIRFVSMVFFFWIFLSMFGISFRIKASPINSKLVSISEIATPSAIEWHSLFFKNQPYIATEDNYKVYRYVGTWGSGTWNEVVDMGASSGTTLMYTEDELSSIFGEAYLNATHNRYYYTDDGTSWTYNDYLSYTGTMAFGFAGVGNGTILTSSYADPDFMFIRKSDDNGQTWTIWKNFTELYPHTADIVQSPYGAWRHAHAISYATNYISISMGDALRSLVVSNDDGQTWNIDKGIAPTGAITLSDRVVFTGDIHESITIYYLSTQKYRNVRVPYWNLFYSFNPTYDSTNDVLYVGLTGANGTHGIIASPDKGESWITIYKWIEGTGEMYVRPYYHNAHVYFTIDGKSVYRRFEALSNEAIRSMSIEKVSYLLNGDVCYYDFGGSEVADIEIAYSQIVLDNVLNNGDFEDGIPASGYGFPNLYELNWDDVNRTYDVVDGVGIGNSKAWKVEYRDGGQEITARMLWTEIASRPRIEYNEGILIIAYVKSNRTSEPVHFEIQLDWVNSTGVLLNPDNGESWRWKDIATKSSNWTKIIGYFNPPPISSSDYFLPIMYLRLRGGYNEDFVDLPWTTFYCDNVTMIPIPSDVMSYDARYPHQSGYTGYNFFAGLYDDSEFYRWIPNAMQMNTESPILKINDEIVSNGDTLRNILSPVKIELTQGGCVSITITKLKTLIESDCAITSATLNDDSWMITIFASAGQTSSTDLYSPTTRKPLSINPSLTNSWSDQFQKLTVTIIHSSEESFTVTWISGASGIFKIRVNVKANLFPILGAIVLIDGMNKTTNALGDAEFELPIGHHLILVQYGENEQSRNIYVSGDMSIGFEFPAPESPREIGVLIALPFGLLIFAVILFFLGRRG